MEITKEDGVLLIKYNNAVKQYEGELSLEKLHEVLECEVVEFCEALCGGMLLIDENGKMMHKRVNYRATAFYKYSYFPDGKPCDIIVGDVLYVPQSTFEKWDKEQEEDCEDEEV